MSSTDPVPVNLVFGATGGIGSALCRRLAARGVRLALVARDADRVRALAAELDAEPYPLDTSRFDDVDACVAAVVQRFGRLDGVANCVGSLLLKPAHTTTEAEWLATLSTNLTTAFAVVRAAARAMTSPGGSIVLVSSAAARIGLANHEAIAAAKVGVIGLTLSAAATYAPRGIRVNCVAPGLVRTPMTTRLTANDASLKASTAMHALGRIGDPADVASAIEWLLGPDSGWVTGQVLGIDGGLTDSGSLLQPLLARLPAGDTAARNELFRYASDRLERLASRMLHHYPTVHRWAGTDDVLQSALIRLLRALETVHPATPRDFLGLAAEQIRRELIDLARRFTGPLGLAANHASRDGVGGSRDPLNAQPASADESSPMAAWCEFHEQVQALPVEEREVMDLLYYQELSQAEAASLLHVTVRTVQRRWQSALLKLHAVLKSQWPGEQS